MAVAEHDSMEGVAVATHVFLDDLILYNLLMNGVLLAVTAYLLRQTTTWRRVLLGAGLGSLYLVTFFIPGLRVLTSVIVRLICPIPMVWLTFPRRRPIELVRLCGTFYLVAMAAGGVSLGAYFISSISPWWQHSSAVLRGLPTWLPLAGAIVLFVLMRWFVTMTRPLWRRIGREYVVKLTLGGQTMTVKALLDTGNELRDPISGRSVMIVDYQHLPVLALTGSYSGSDEEVCALAECLAGGPLADRVHLLPYRTLGRGSGLLLALRPDALSILTDDGERPVPQILIGVGQNLTPSGRSYQALLPAAVADLLSPPQLPRSVNHAT